MSKVQAKRDYACIHTGCAFKTDKRKAIYTHLIRTHCERKEDYECEYCDTLFEEESVIEEHLYAAHPGCQFRYTCVSRLENLLNRCVQLAAQRKKINAAKKSRSPGSVKSPATENNIAESENAGKHNVVPSVTENEKLAQKPKSSSLKRKTSVNESLNNLAKLPRIAVPENPLAVIQYEPLDSEPNHKLDEDVNDFVDEGEASTFISKPSGLKIKLNLKKIRDSCSRESSAEPQSDMRVTESLSDLREMSPLDESDILQTENSVTGEENPAVDINSEPMDKPLSRSAKTNRSSYLDKLEVYHTTDEFNRRCCPFCDYKTTKNTIRVHLSGKHKIYFVMCSACDYRAAFPYQVQSHGLSCHQIRNIEVIHLAKSYREGVIARIKAGMDEEEATGSNTVAATDESLKAEETYDGETSATFDEQDSTTESEELIPPKPHASDPRVFKPPVCQTSKTDYYSIAYENGTYLYCCSQCDFRTPVRATIYTHKYRHDEKAYKCVHCDFVSSPRSNVAHHIRGRHKGKSFDIEEIAAPDQLKLTGTSDDRDVLEPTEELIKKENEMDSKAYHSDKGEDILSPVLNVKQEIVDENTAPEVKSNTDDLCADRSLVGNSSPQPDVKPQKTIIKVPHFKRTLTSVAPNPVPKEETTLNSTKPKQISVVQGPDCKLSLNKLYRYNPNGTPKYLCNQCPYACDTHPKMKHHLYRHKPQRYKCPYCSHRKYPRSYVVRHVRDTHRDKPVKVIDLLKAGDIEDDLDDSDPINDMDDMNMDTSRVDAMQDESDQETADIPPDTQYILNDIVSPEQKTVVDNITMQHETVGDESEATPLRYNPSGFVHMDESPDRNNQKSPDISTPAPPLFSSTPITGSALFDLACPTTQSSSKKPTKNYDVDTKRKPRYICNFCQYGTENYKTIHNHMYRHERIKYRCPYCGFKRAPRSFVENHIRDVHKDQPVFTTEVIDEEATKVIACEVWNNSTLKRKDPPETATPSSLHPTLQKKLKPDVATPTSSKWQAPKSSSKINTSLPEMPPLQIPVKRKTPGSAVSPIIPTINVPTRPLSSPVGPPNVTISASSPVPVLQKPAISPPMASVSSPIIKSEPPHQGEDEHNESDTNALQNGKTAIPTYKDGGKTTFKTMYKCVFDPETCNHISKDRSKMKQHLFMHVEYKPWTCDYCNMTASQSSHVKNHVRAEHPEAEISFQYKRHNYLEKHIDSFLQKGVFTVPVSEYRFIMDMKGSSKKPQFEYARDNEGYLLCPHCDYHTKSGGMSDHVKMKHMQPRFKCHWCDFKAFYRSEVRKHHRKERGHAHLEFKTQELDLAEVLEDYKEGNGDIPDALQNSLLIPSSRDDGLDSESVSKSNSPEPSEPDDDDLSSNADSAISDSTALSNNLSDSAFLKLSLPYSFESIDSNADSVQPSGKNINTKDVLNHSSIKDKNVNTKDNTKSAKTNSVLKGASVSLYKCGYCLFSAKLRTMVKMHCQKQHPYRKIHVAEPKLQKVKVSVEKPESKPSDLKEDSRNIDSKTVADEPGQPTTASLISKIAPLLKQTNNNSSNSLSAMKKNKSLKSVIDQLSSKAKEKGESEVNMCCDTIADTPISNEKTGLCHCENQNKTEVGASLSSKQTNTETGSWHTSSRKSKKPHHISPNLTDSEVYAEDNKSTCEHEPPVLTKALCDYDHLKISDTKEVDVTPPLLVNETETTSKCVDQIKFGKENNLNEAETDVNLASGSLNASAEDIVVEKDADTSINSDAGSKISTCSSHSGITANSYYTNTSSSQQKDTSVTVHSEIPSIIEDSESSCKNSLENPKSEDELSNDQAGENKCPVNASVVDEENRSNEMRTKDEGGTGCFQELQYTESNNSSIDTSQIKTLDTESLPGNCNKENELDNGHTGIKSDTYLIQASEDKTKRISDQLIVPETKDEIGLTNGNEKCISASLQLFDSTLSQKKEIEITSESEILHVAPS